VIGQDSLIEMRRAGYTPDAVFLDINVPRAAKGADMWRDWALQIGQQCRIALEPDENLDRLDLRFLIGLNVLVFGGPAEQTEAVAEVCRRFQAKRVTVFDDEGMTMPNGQRRKWPAS
jgi:hypothetical protein